MLARKLLLALALLFPLAAAAQQYPNHSAIIGAGPGIKSFKSVGPCPTGQVLLWASGTGADPSCGSPTVSGGLIIGTTPITGGTIGNTLVVGSGLTLNQLAVTYPGSLILVGTVDTQTLTNKTLAGPTISGTVLGTYTLGGNVTLPAATTSVLGAVFAISPISHQWISSIGNGTGIPVLSQPSYADLSGSIPSGACTPAVAGTLGCVQGVNSVTSNWINSIVNGVPVVSQPTFNDISGQAGIGQMPSIANQTIISNISGTNPNTAAANTLTGILDNILGTTQGNVIYRGASSWTVLGPGSSGQLLSSNGPSANLSWITASGTGTVTSVMATSGLNATSVNPITGAGVIGLTGINAGYVLSNVTGGPLAPTGNTLSATLDAALGSTQGNILYRGASTWTVLAPGTKGQVLTTSGTSANPIWATGASIQASPSNPTNTSSGSFVMGGFGGSCVITPTTTGRVRFNINGSYGNTTSADGVSIKLAYGTGTAPTANAAATGTVIGNPRTIGATFANFWAASVQGQATGLTLGSAVWFDIQWEATTGGTAAGQNIDCNAQEF